MYEDDKQESEVAFRYIHGRINSIENMYSWMSVSMCPSLVYHR